jgi:4-aminobutyrate aminotransferase-like enzyme
MDAVAPGGLGGTFGGNPLSCAAALAVLDALAEPGFRSRSEELGRRLRAGLDGLASRVPEVGEVRGLGPMLALELAEQSPTLAAATVEAAFERGLLLLSCGIYGNVLRLLPPLTIADEEAKEGLAILEESLVDAVARP